MITVEFLPIGDFGTDVIRYPRILRILYLLFFQGEGSVHHIVQGINQHRSFLVWITLLESWAPIIRHDKFMESCIVGSSPNPRLRSDPFETITRKQLGLQEHSLVVAESTIRSR